MGFPVSDALRRTWACLAALLTLGVCRVVLAQTQQEFATRRVLLDRAAAERAAGRHTEALLLAQRAAAVRMTPSVRLFIAQLQDLLGDPAGALGHAEQCAQEAERDRAVPNREALRDTCRALAASARTRVGFVVLRAPDERTEGLEVTVRGVTLSAALVGVPYVVSPGEVEVEARAPGRVTFRGSHTVAAGETVTVTVSLPATPVEPPPVIPAPPVVQAASPTPAPAATVVTPRPVPPSRSSLAPALLFASSAATLAGGVALLFVREDALAGCTVRGTAAECDSPAAVTSASNANGLAAGAGVLLGVGVTAALTATVLLLVRPRGARTERVSVGVAPTRAGVAFGLTVAF